MNNTDPSGQDELLAQDPWPLLIEVTLGMRRWWIDVCDGLELTPVQGLALRLLDPNRPSAMSTLADDLACDASNITGVVDKLEGRGLISRQGAEHDRRVKMLVVTEKGQELRSRLLARAMVPPPALASQPRDVRDKMATALRAILLERASVAAGSSAPAAQETSTI